MIYMNFNSYASFIIFFVIHVFFCFWTWNPTYHTSVKCIWVSITIHNLTYLTECENLQNVDSPFRFLFEDFHLCSCYNNINYCTWYFYKHLFGSSFATSRLACSEFHFQLTKKSQTEVQEMVNHITNWQSWCDNFSSALCFVLL